MSVAVSSMMSLKPSVHFILGSVVSSSCVRLIKIFLRRVTNLPRDSVLLWDV